MLTHLKVPKEPVSFFSAFKQGLSQQDAFFPTSWPTLEIEALLAMPFKARSSVILHALMGDELPLEDVSGMVDKAFMFDAPLINITENIACVELFHGPTLTFKDFGMRFMAQVFLKAFNNEKITLLCATAGDSGAALAQALYAHPNVQVVILYPKDKISPLQEKLFSTLGENVTALAVEGDFDCCQKLVTQLFEHKTLVDKLNIQAVEPTNIAWLFAQVCYYFEAFSRLTPKQRQQLVVSVPSGHFGNLTSALIAKALGLPIKRFIAATNSNDTVARFWQNSQGKNAQWQVNPTISTLTSAMDITFPNNWQQVEALLAQGIVSKDTLDVVSLDDEDTILAVKKLSTLGYISEPHTALAFKALNRSLQEGEFGFFLATAHPAKFKANVENILGTLVALPEALSLCASEQGLSKRIAADVNALALELLTLEQK